jgi:DNA-directed RNA polymerase specialized sigma24 family protein
MLKIPSRCCSLNFLGLDPQAKSSETPEALELWSLVDRELARHPRPKREAFEALIGQRAETYRDLARRHKVSKATIGNWAHEIASKLRPQLGGWQ